MPLYEYECLKCRKNLEQSVKQLGKKITKKTVSDLVGKYSNIHHIGVIDLENESVIAENGKRLPGSVDLDFYLNDGSIMILINMDKFRFSELIYEKADEKKVKCYCGESRKVEKVVSTFALLCLHLPLHLICLQICLNPIFLTFQKVLEEEQC